MITNYSKPFKEEVYAYGANDFTHFSGIPIQKTGSTITLSVTGLQGGCYLSAADQFLAAFTDVSSNKSGGILVKFNRNYGITARSSNLLPIGHANGMCYNPNTNRVYIAPGNEGPTADRNKLRVINPGNLNSIESYITITGVNYVKGIAFDNQNSCYYLLMDDGYIYRYDSSFQPLSDGFAADCRKATLQSTFMEREDMGAAVQDVFCYNGNLFVLCSVSYTDPAEDTQEILSHQRMAYYILQFDTASGDLIWTSQYNAADNSDEAEFAALIGSDDYVFRGQNTLRVSRLTFGSEKIRFAHQDYFCAGNIIAAYDGNSKNLNSYIIEGRYYSPSSSVTSYISNCPVSGPFSLMVEPLGRSLILQKLVSSSPDIYVRHCITGASFAWTSWKKVTLTTV